MCLQEVYLGVGESIPVLIQFDPSYKDDFVTRTAESQLEVLFKEHPQTVNSILHLCLLWNGRLMKLDVDDVNGGKTNVNEVMTIVVVIAT